MQQTEGDAAQNLPPPADAHHDPANTSSIAGKDSLCRLVSSRFPCVFFFFPSLGLRREVPAFPPAAEQGIKTGTKTCPQRLIGTRSSGEADGVSSAAVHPPNEQTLKKYDGSRTDNCRLLSGRCQLSCQRGCCSTGPRNPNQIR